MQNIDTGILLGGDTYQEGKACYRLGNANEEQGDPESAIMVI